MTEIHEEKSEITIEFDMKELNSTENDINSIESIQETKEINDIKELKEIKEELYGIQLVSENMKEFTTFLRKIWNDFYFEPMASIKQFLTSKVFFLAMYVVIGGFLNGMFITFSQEYQRQWSRQHPSVPLKTFILSDILFEILPFFPSIETGDLYLTFMVVFVCLRFLVTKGRELLLKRFFLILGTMFYIRFTCLYFTLLNDPSYNISNVSMNPLFESAFVSFGIHVSTVDKMFSGHTASLTIAGLFLIEYHDKYPLINSKKYSPMLSRLFEIFVIIYLCGGYCLFAMTRIHYSSDIFIAVIIAGSLFYLYKHYRPFIYTRNNSLNKFLCWVEEEAIDIPIIKFVEGSPSNDVETIDEKNIKKLSN